MLFDRQQNNYTRALLDAPADSYPSRPQVLSSLRDYLRPQSVCANLNEDSLGAFPHPLRPFLLTFPDAHSHVRKELLQARLEGA